ncbi:uncharacterized protein LOC113315823 [Papaver somniferum]|uniref:uncharacterized protein LOC113315823 n=1 Tax=Papaver somniferum TaxID=3469 RepID=UPI000E6FA1D8|nr:uncharacterized protein LOC113315823 [Papaver somniferum]
MKSKVFVGGVNEGRKQQIADDFNFPLSKMPDKYLGVILQPGESDTRKAITLKWDKVCVPLEEGGLGIKRLEIVNKSFLMKLLWKLLESEAEWAVFMRAKYFTDNGELKTSYKKSSILPGLKWLEELPILSTGEDKRIWSGTMTGEFTVKSAVECIRTHYDKKGRGYNLASKCYMYANDSENLEHILWNCNFSQIIRKWLGSMFLFLNPQSYEDVMTLTGSKSSAVQEVWILSASITMMEMWFLRNKIAFEEIRPDIGTLKRKILKFTKDNELRITGKMWDCSYDFQVFRNFDLKNRPVRRLQKMELKFELPCRNQIMVCCVGVSRGNPGVAGIGFITRNHEGYFYFAEVRGLGIATTFIAELMAVMCDTEWDTKNGVQDLIIKSGSKAAVTSFLTGKMPWFLNSRWKRIKNSSLQMKFVHCYKEVNFTANALEKRGAGLNKGESQQYLMKPSFLKDLEVPGRTYIRSY